MDMKIYCIIAWLFDFEQKKQKENLGVNIFIGKSTRRYGYKREQCATCEGEKECAYSYSETFKRNASGLMIAADFWKVESFLYF